MIQYSFKDKDVKSSLFIVATPIGNMNEMSPRAIKVLKMVDVIYCEDKRTSHKLLHFFDIKNKVMALHKFNETAQIDFIIDNLAKGFNVAIISDAGYPLISDPGSILVRSVVEKRYSVIPVSGSNAFINAVVSSGLRTDVFTFIGFLKGKTTTKRKKELSQYKNYYGTIVFHESPNRIIAFLEDVSSVFGNVRVSVAKELTKLHEHFFRGDITAVIKELKESNLLGEFIISIENNYLDNDNNDKDIIDELINSKKRFPFLTSKDLISLVSYKLSESKNLVYDLWNKVKGEENE